MSKPLTKAHGPVTRAHPPFSRAEGIAVWRQIADDITTKIRDSSWVEGMRLPTETELAAAYGVNRHTLRRALAELSRRGLIEASPRRGTFVSSSRIEYPIHDRTRFSEIIRSAGRDPGGRVLSSQITTAPPEMARALGIAERAPVVQLERLRLANDVPICWSMSWLPGDRFERLPRLMERCETLTAALSALGIRNYHRAETRISARAATPRERCMLELPKGAAVLVTESINVDDDREPIQAGRSIFAASIVHLLVES
ncbi:MAG: phosphonate metabolism transcriptional regulator PhnF [Hyphomicrobiaceae bacterium]